MLLLSRVCLVWLFTAVAMVALAPPAKADLLWGVNGHPLVSYPGVTFDQQVAFVKDLGMTSYRVDIGHLGQMPALARLIQAAKPRGIQILPVIVPALNLKRDSPEQLYAKARALAVTLVSRFKDDIRVWELGNELENYAIIQPCEMQDNGVQYNCAWGPAGGVTALEYYGPRWAKVSAVLKGLSDGTTAVDPTIRKAMGTAGWGHLGAFTRMQQDGIQWDISVWHMYGQDPEWAFKFLSGFKRPIWVTEFNHASGGHRSALEQADGLVRTMIRLRQLQGIYNVEAAHLYELMDESYWAPNFEAFMGLVTLEKNDSNQWKPGARKPAYGAVKRLIADPGPPGTISSDCHLNPLNKLDSAIAMQVSYVYCLALQRPVDGQGFKDWSSALKMSMTPAQLLQATMSSAEFWQKHSVAALGDREFVDLLYRVLLYRAPDEAERRAQVDKLEKNSIARAGLAAILIGSSEFREQHPLLFPVADSHVPPSIGSTKAMREQARTCDPKIYDVGDARPENRAAYAFCLILGRATDEAALRGWSEFLNRGRQTSQMLLTMLASPEFRDRHGVPGLRTTDFVALMHRFLLGREPEPGGLADYIAEIEAGTLSRSDLPMRIIESGEFGARHPLLRTAAPASSASPPGAN